MKDRLVVGGAVALVLTVCSVASIAVAGSLGGEPPADDSPIGPFVAVHGVNTVTGEIGPVASDAADSFDVSIPADLGVASVSFAGPAGVHSVSGCGLAGPMALDQTFDPVIDPGDGGCTLTIDLTIDTDPAVPAWTVTVVTVDIQAPVIDAGSFGNVEVSTDPGAATAVVVYDLPTATDNVDPAPVVTCDPVSGSTFDAGATTVTCTATDASGNVSEAVAFDVAVVDTEPPVISVPADIEADATSLAGAEVEYDASATDNVAVDTFGCDPESGETFSLGVTGVDCEAVDTSGNTADDSFEVTVSVAGEGSSVEIIIDDIASQEFDNHGIGTSLAAPLGQAGKLIDDDNSANDVAACNKIKAFLKHVEQQERKGRIDEEYAALLAEFTDGEYGLNEALGC